MNMQSDSNFYVKLLVIGDAVGKTSIISRFCNDKFNISSWRTIGADYIFKTLELDGKILKIQIWDISSEERFSPLTQPIYKDSMGVILAYSVEDPQSLRNIDNWMKEVQEHAPANACKILIGNKCDITDRIVSYEDGKKLADKYDIPFYETSAKNGININETFTAISRDIKNKILEEKTSFGLNDIKKQY